MEDGKMEKFHTIMQNYGIKVFVERHITVAEKDRRRSELA